MNLDFHLYGTYAAALMAGFKENSARKIAMAAQMVDDFTEDVTGDIMISTATNVENLKNTIETIAKTKIKYLYLIKMLELIVMWLLVLLCIL